MTRTTLAGSLAALLITTGFSPAATLYGSYNVSASHTCMNGTCTDVINATGTNTVMPGISDLTATLTEDAAGNIEPGGPITIVSLANGGAIFGTLDLGWVAAISPPAFELIGSVEFTRGTGAYYGFTATEDAVGTGFFTGPHSAEGTLTFAPEPQTWALLVIAVSGLLVFRRLSPAA